MAQTEQLEVVSTAGTASVALVLTKFQDEGFGGFGSDSNSSVNTTPGTSETTANFQKQYDFDLVLNLRWLC